jgi:hypothetical protein
MHNPVAGSAVGGVGITAGGRLSVDAFAEILYLLGMALGALYRHRLCRRGHFMRIPVARLAGQFTQRSVNAPGYMRSLVRVTAQATNLRHSVGVGKIFDGRVAVNAREGAMHAGGMASGINRDAFASG